MLCIMMVLGVMKKTTANVPPTEPNDYIQKRETAKSGVWSEKIEFNPPGDWSSKKKSWFIFSQRHSQKKLKRQNSNQWKKGKMACMKKRMAEIEAG